MPRGPDRLAAQLQRYGLALVGGFVALVLREEDNDGAAAGGQSLPMLQRFAAAARLHARRWRKRVEQISPRSA